MPTNIVDSSISSTSVVDLDALRLPPNYSESLGVKKVLTNVYVGRPDKAKFFQVKPGGEGVFGAYILQLREANETYLVAPHVTPVLGGLVRPVQLHAAIDRHNNPFLVPVFLPGEDGKRNPWHESMAQAVELAKTHWVRVVANMSVGAYDVLQALGALPEPIWPDITMDELIKVAFRGRIIDSEDHPVVLSVLGAA